MIVARLSAPPPKMMPALIQWPRCEGTTPRDLKLQEDISLIGGKLILSRVQKKYADIWAVRETSLEIEPGEFVSIVGPSGSGKTSLLSMIAGFESPTAGTIWIADKDITHLPPNRRDIGMVFQKYALFPHLTIAQNIEFPLKMRRGLSGMSLKRRVEDILELVQLSEYRDRYPSQLSGGQQQRVAVARAVVFEPSIVLMDEPLGALDKKLRETMQFELKHLQQRLGATIVYVTHDQDEALAMSDRVAVMKQGTVQQIGTPVELYSKPANAFVADFIGVMNFIPGVHVGTDGNHAMIQIAEETMVRVPFISDGGMARATADASFDIAIRPEDIRITLLGEGRGGAIAGMVETSVFLGSTHILLVRLKTVDGIVLRVEMPAGLAASFQRGMPVDVDIDETKLQIFPVKEGLAA